MARLKENDSLASSMGTIMSGEEHKALFKPQIKTAATKEVHPIEQAFNKLILVSEKLEELDLEKSAAKFLNLANKLASQGDWWDKDDEETYQKSKSFDKETHDWTELNDYLGDLNSRYLEDNRAGSPLDITNQLKQTNVNPENLSENEIYWNPDNDDHDTIGESIPDYLIDQDEIKEFDLDDEYDNLLDEQDASDKSRRNIGNKGWKTIKNLIDDEKELNQSEEENWLDQIIDEDSRSFDFDESGSLFDKIRGDR